MSVSTGSAGGSKTNMPMILGILVVILVLAIVIGSRVAPHQDVMKLPETAGVKFMKQKAIECKGDFSKLSPEDQAKVQQYSNKYGAMSMQMYYQASQKK